MGTLKVNFYKLINRLKQNKIYFASLLLFPFLIWGLFIFYFGFINPPDDFFGYGMTFAIIYMWPIMFLGCVVFAVVVAKIAKQSVWKSIVLILFIFFISPTILSLPRGLINNQIPGLGQKGLQKNNPDYCQCEIELSTTYTRKKLGYECLAQLAFNNNDIFLCEKIDDSYFKMKCYRDLADKNNDPALCDKLTMPLCLKDNGYNECIDECYAALAVKNDNLSLCDLVKTDEYKLRCYKGLAYKDNNPSLCEKLTGLIRKGWKSFTGTDCLHEGTALRTSCQTVFADDCYVKLAMSNSDADICLKIQDEAFKNMCLLQLR